MIKRTLYIVNESLLWNFIYKANQIVFHFQGIPHSVHSVALHIPFGHHLIYTALYGPVPQRCLENSISDHLQGHVVVYHSVPQSGVIRWWVLDSIMEWKFAHRWVKVPWPGKATFFLSFSYPRLTVFRFQFYLPSLLLVFVGTQICCEIEVHIRVINIGQSVELNVSVVYAIT